MTEISWIKQLKLRGAYGYNANVAKNALPQVIASANFNSFSPGGRPAIQALSILSYANSGLRWEETRNGNLGLDFSIFKNITGNVDFYNKKSTDLLANSQIDATYGGAFALVNQAAINNKGLEIGLHADWITHQTFNWNTGLSFSRNTSKVLAVYNSTLTPASPSYAYVSGTNANFFKGYPIGAMFEYRNAGVDNAGNALIYGADDKPHAFLSPDGKIGDVRYAGTSIPPVNAGLSNRVDIGHFYVYCMINYYGGFLVRAPIPTPYAVRPLAGAGNYWRKAGDENIPDILPSLAYVSNTYVPYLNASDKYTVRGDYFTLGDVTVSYNFGGTPFFRKAGFKQFELKMQASNIYTFALNKYNYSMATGSYVKSYLTPTYTIGLFTNF